MDVQNTLETLWQHMLQIPRASITWRRPETTPADPLNAAVDPGWPVWDGNQQRVLRKNEENWLYAELAFPDQAAGVDLAGTEAHFYVSGWCPFTFWLDGVEIFREDHVWHATGPITDPVIRHIEPGRTHRLVLCLKPTELPSDLNMLTSFEVRYGALERYVVDMSAAILQIDFAHALADNDEEHRRVHDVVDGLDLDALTHLHLERFSDSLRTLEERLEWLRDRAHGYTMHMVGHSHIDMDWLWTWDDTVHCIRRDFKAVSDMQDDVPELTFTHSQVPTYQVVREQDPDVFEKVRRRVREGRWEYAAGTWVEGDLNMADGESIARHMLYAHDWGMENLGVSARVLWEPDTFGHPGNMPQLAKLGGHDCYFHMRCNPGGYEPWLTRLWEGVDGTKIMTFSCVYNAFLYPNYLAQNLRSAVKAGTRNVLFVWGVGDHGGAMSRYQIGLLDRYRHKPVVPELMFSTMSRLLEAVEKENVQLPTNKGWTFNLFDGCFTTHAAMKSYMRRCEGALLAAESLTALAHVDRRDTLRKAWTDSLFNHFHDISDGAAVHDSYEDAYRRAESSLSAASGVRAQALEALLKQDADGPVLVLVNPLGCTRTEPVAVDLPDDTRCLVDSEGACVPVQRKDDHFVLIARDIPAFGMKAYRITNRCAPTANDVTAGDRGHHHGNDGYYYVETAHAIARVCRQSGIIGSYFDKQLGRELVGYGFPKYTQPGNCARSDLALNVFQLTDEAPGGMSAWLVRPAMRVDNLLQGADVEVIETGPVFARLRVTHRFRSSCIVEDILFYNDLNRVEFELDIDWRETGDAEKGVPQLKMAFGASVGAPMLRSEGPFVVNRLPADGQENVTQKWVDISGDGLGFALLNDGRYGFDALGGRLRMTVLRNAYSPDPETDNGRHRLRLALIPHDGRMSNAELMRRGMGFNRPPVAVRTGDAPDETPWFEIHGDGSVVCSSLKPAEHAGGLVLRLFEASGDGASVRITFRDGFRALREVNFLEQDMEPSVDVQPDGAVRAEFRPFEVKTLLVEGPRTE